MRFGLVIESVPNPSTAGGAMSNWGLIQAMVEQGHHVTAFIILPRKGEPAADHLEALKRLGVHVELMQTPPVPADLGVFQKLRRLLLPKLEDVFPAHLLRDELTNRLDQGEFDALYVFDYGPLLALERYSKIPRFASLGDPYHQVSRFGLKNHADKFSRSFLIAFVGSLAMSLRHPRQIVRLVSRYDGVGWFASQHAKWLRDRGIDCKHIHVPVTDSIGEDWKKRHSVDRVSKKPKLMLVGHLLGTANLRGLYPFVRETLPMLEKELGPEAFEVHIIGRDNPPADLLDDLKKPYVKLRGFIRDLNEEFITGDAFLSPSIYPVGIRSRVLLALSYGICVVAHKSSCLGIPELIHGKNCLLTEGNRDLAEGLTRAIKDPALMKKLGDEARVTYEKFFSPKAAGGEIIREMESLASRRGAARV